MYVSTPFSLYFLLSLSLQLTAIEINAALLLETVRPADNPHSASLMRTQWLLSYGLFYLAFVGGAVICFAYWYNNTRRKDDGKWNMKVLVF